MTLTRRRFLGRAAMGIAAAVVLGGVGWTAATRARKFYVSTAGDDRNEGLAPETAWRTLSHAARTAPYGSTVHVAPGNYDASGIVLSGRDLHAVIPA
jgi:hypothetical protein